MVVTRGFRRDPRLELIEEASWELTVRVDEEGAISSAQLAAVNDAGWVTLFVPPRVFGTDLTELLPSWEILQWWYDEDGSRTRHARAGADMSNLLDLVPPRFHRWVLDITEEAVSSLNQLASESSQLDLDADDAASLLDDAAALSQQLEHGRAREACLQRGRERIYGEDFHYDFPDELDLNWWLSSDDGVESLNYGPRAEDDRAARAYVPPDEFTGWRWTVPGTNAASGELLTPKEVLSRVPSAYYGWVALRTHEAFQRTRHALHRLQSGSMADAGDFAQLARLAKHAASLLGQARKSSIGYPEATTPEEEDVLGGTRSPDGRIVVLLAGSWRHVLTGHPEMDEHLDAVMRTLEQPEFREPDPRIGRERYFSRRGPEAWLRVVVEIAGPVDRVVTAFPQANPPTGWRAK